MLGYYFPRPFIVDFLLKHPGADAKDVKEAIHNMEGEVKDPYLKENDISDDNKKKFFQRFLGSFNAHSDNKEFLSFEIFEMVYTKLETSNSPFFSSFFLARESGEIAFTIFYNFTHSKKNIEGFFGMINSLEGKLNESIKGKEEERFKIFLELSKLLNFAHISANVLSIKPNEPKKQEGIQEFFSLIEFIFENVPLEMTPQIAARIEDYYSETKPESYREMEEYIRSVLHEEFTITPHEMLMRMIQKKIQSIPEWIEDFLFPQNEMGKNFLESFIQNRDALGLSDDDLQKLGELLQDLSFEGNETDTIAYGIFISNMNFINTEHIPVGVISDYLRDVHSMTSVPDEYRVHNEAERKFTQDWFRDRGYEIFSREFSDLKSETPE